MIAFGQYCKSVGRDIFDNAATLLILSIVGDVSVYSLHPENDVV